MSKQAALQRLCRSSGHEYKTMICIHCKGRKPLQVGDVVVASPSGVVTADLRGDNDPIGVIVSIATEHPGMAKVLMRHSNNQVWVKTE